MNTNTTKFDLARFKAGEVAEDDNYERYFLAELPNGEIAYKWRSKANGDLGATSYSLDFFEEYTTMKPKEEWWW